MFSTYDGDGVKRERRRIKEGGGTHLTFGETVLVSFIVRVRLEAF